MQNILTFPTDDRSLAVLPCDTVSLVQNTNISLADREMSLAFLFNDSFLVSPPARALGTRRAVSGILASSPLAVNNIPGPPEACMIPIISTGRGCCACAASGGTGTG